MQLGRNKAEGQIRPTGLVFATWAIKWSRQIFLTTRKKYILLCELAHTHTHTNLKEKCHKRIVNFLCIYNLIFSMFSLSILFKI